MSRYVRVGGSSGSSSLSASDVCNILCTYQGTLSARNACLVCNLRTQYEIICYCPCWTTSYGTSFVVNLPTTEYSEFVFGMAGMAQCGGGANSNFLAFGNDSCFCTGTAYCNMQYTYPAGSCIISCNPSFTYAACFSNTATCNSSSIFINVKKTWGRESTGSCFNCPLIAYCGSHYSNCFAVMDEIRGISLVANNAFWTNTSSSSQFTRMRICSACNIQSPGGYWYILGMKNRTCAI